MLGVLIFDTLPGLVIGIIVSLLLLLYRLVEAARRRARPRRRDARTSSATVDRHPENEAVPGVAVLRVEAGLFFANADAVRRAIKQHAARPGVPGVVLDAESIPFVDVTAVRMLDELADDLARDGQQLVIAHDLGQVGDLLGRRSATPSIQVRADDRRAAIAAINDGCRERTG